MSKLKKREKKTLKDDGKINRIAFLSTLDLVRPALDEKGLMSQVGHFIFSEDKISTYNNWLSVTVLFPVGVRGSVRADGFYKLVKEADCGELEILEEGKKLKIKGGGFKASFVFMDEEGEVERLIDSLNLNGLDWKPLPDNFKEGLDLCSFSMDMAGELSSVFVDGDSVYSSDDLRISWYVMDKGIDGSILVPRSSVRELLKYDIKDYAVDGSWAHFRSPEGDCVFSCQLMKSEFPDAKGFFGFESEMEIELPDALSGVLKRSIPLASGDSDIDKEIDIRIDKDRIVCHGERKGYSDIEEELEFKGVEEPILMRINPVFFLQVLDKTRMMYYSEGIDRVEFRSENFRHVIALVMEK